MIRCLLTTYAHQLRTSLSCNCIFSVFFNEISIQASEREEKRKKRREVWKMRLKRTKRAVIGILGLTLNGRSVPGRRCRQFTFVISRIKLQVADDYFSVQSYVAAPRSRRDVWRRHPFSPGGEQAARKTLSKLRLRAIR